MQGVDLYEYCLSDSFLLSLHGKYRFLVTDLVVENSESFDFTIYTLGSFGYDFSVNGELVAFLEQKSSILLLLKNISSIYLLPWLDHYRLQGGVVTIVNMGVGVTSLLSKDEHDITDVYNVFPYLSVFEPISLQQFNALIFSGLPCYIRILQQIVVEVHPPYLDESGFFSFTRLGCEGNDATVVLGGQYLNYAQAIYSGCKTQSLLVDVFALSHYQFFLSGEVLQSIKTTGKLIFVLDHDMVSILPLLKSAIFDAGISDLVLTVLTPIYGDVQTLMLEYCHEEAVFDVEGLVARICASCV